MEGGAGPAADRYLADSDRTLKRCLRFLRDYTEVSAHLYRSNKRGRGFSGSDKSKARPVSHCIFLIRAPNSQSALAAAWPLHGADFSVQNSRAACQKKKKSMAFISGGVGKSISGLKMSRLLLRKEFCFAVELFRFAPSQQNSWGISKSLLHMWDCRGGSSPPRR